MVEPNNLVFSTVPDSLREIIYIWAIFLCFIACTTLKCGWRFFRISWLFLTFIKRSGPEWIWHSSCAYEWLWQELITDTKAHINKINRLQLFVCPSSTQLQMRHLLGSVLSVAKTPGSSPPRHLSTYLFLTVSSKKHCAYIRTLLIQYLKNTASFKKSSVPLFHLLSFILSS